MTFNLDGKYKLLTINRQHITWNTSYTYWFDNSCFYVYVDGVAKYSCAAAIDKNPISIDLTGATTLKFTACVGCKSSGVFSGSVDGILIKWLKKEKKMDNLIKFTGGAN